MRLQHLRLSGAGAPAARVLRQQARQAGSTSFQFLGVTRHEGTGKWQAHVPDPKTGTDVSLGLFSSRKDAVKAFDCAVLAVVGPSAETNFPKELYAQEAIEQEGKNLRNRWVERPSAKYYGVYQNGASTRWQAHFEMYGVEQFLDFFEDELEAAKAVDESIRDTGAEKALQLKLLNFRQDDDFFDEETWEDEPIPRKMSSRFLGVSYHQPTDRFLAKLGRKHIGLFDTEVEAARAFDEASAAKGGVTNFRPVGA